ncbi:MAG: hypothetical protein WC881_07460 [Elusimicrobiota bacterium]|jgi:hypothetical protein
MRDYFPLDEGLALEYISKSASGTGGYRFEVVTSADSGGVIRAHCRRVPRDAGGKAWDAQALKDGRGVFFDAALELPLPPEPGRRWTRAPNQYRIDAADAVVTVPAGTFRDCLRVVYTIAGGDAGWGERLYAPGVGLVYEMCSDEAEPFELLLTRFIRGSSPGPS